jgi:hypothetical protein
VTPCECGCGEPTKPAPATRKDRGWIKGEPIRFIVGHNQRGTTGIGRPPTPEAERFWRHVVKTDTCWLWTGSADRHGYGRFTLNDHRNIKQRTKLAHRYAYEELIGPIPEGLVLDHVKARGCANPSCVNPAHLEPVTQRENTLRGKAATKTHCKRGHLYDEANTGFTTQGHRRCRTCARDKQRRLRKPPTPDASSRLD